MYNLNNISYLDSIRLNHGIDRLKVYFLESAKDSEDEVIDLINDESLHFASLFVLKSEIEESDIFNNLNLRNKVALAFTNEILKREKKASVNDYVSSDYTQIIYTVLKWILESGVYDDGLDNEYDEILDMAAILLTRVYRDQAVLPIIVDSIFKRNRDGFFIHDLVWALFESRDPHGLTMIANRLLSTEKVDVQLASSLLSFVPGINKEINTNKEREYLSFQKWFDENSSFFYFTGQSLQQTNKPTPYVVVLEAKYLCRFVSVDTGKALKPLTEEEHTLLKEFNKLDLDTKNFLASFSNMMHQKNTNWWNTWIHYPVKEQVKIAKTMIGGEQ